MTCMSPMVNVLTVACTGVWGMGQRMSALTFRYRKIFKLTKVFSGVAAGVEEQAAPLRVATEVGTASLCSNRRRFLSVAAAFFHSTLLVPHAYVLLSVASYPLQVTHTRYVGYVCSARRRLPRSSSTSL